MYYYIHHSDMDAPQYVHVDVLQIFKSLEYFITHTTVIWTLPSMCTLMNLQMFKLLECFITHITAIWMLPNVYTKM